VERHAHVLRLVGTAEHPSSDAIDATHGVELEEDPAKSHSADVRRPVNPRARRKRKDDVHRQHCRYSQRDFIGMTPKR